MTRRLALVIVGVVVATLLVAGAGTLTLAAVRARANTVDELREQASSIAANIDEILDIDVPLDTPEGKVQLRNRLRLLGVMRNVMSIDAITVLVTDRNGTLSPEGLPQGLSLADLSPERLAAGETVSGSRSRLAFAAAPVAGPAAREYVVVLTRNINPALGAAVRLFLWASAATVLLALGASVLLGRRLARPLREASAATQRIAAGELTARLPEPPVHHHDELAELSRNINGMAAALERARGLEQQFLLSVSHDLRTPLTSIRGYAEALDDGNVDPARAAGVIRSEAQRLERLVADLLDLAKLQARAFTFAMTRVDISAAVHTAVAGATGSRADISFQPVTTGPITVLADPDRLAQVLANLIDNAGRYARESVLVSARADAGWAVVTVDDDGPGIAAHDLPHVFERLYVARHQPERRESSSGLGLAIAHELVTAMGGEVSAGTAPHGGARLSVRLPLAGP